MIPAAQLSLTIAAGNVAQMRMTSRIVLAKVHLANTIDRLPVGALDIANDLTELDATLGRLQDRIVELANRGNQEPT